MDKSAGQNHAVRLYPAIEPFDRQMLNVGDGHRLYLEQCGNPDGAPVIVLHGGPGGGCSPTMRRYFDPKKYRVILFDQRGCGRSRPHASIEANTTWHLVDDIERIRSLLSIDRWTVFGGSWGATLALIYAIRHPAVVSHLVLRGVFLMTPRELRWFYGGGAGAFWPDAWKKFAGLIPESERDNLISAFNRRLFSGDGAVQAQFAKAWTEWENSMASSKSMGHSGIAPTDYARAFARIENHYFSNLGWLESSDWILENAGELTNIPGDIVHGKKDTICLPDAALRLSQAWPKSNLSIVSNAGHALSEPAISQKLLEITDSLH